MTNFTNIDANLTGVSYSSVATADFDGDLDLDLVVTGYDGGGPIAKIYENDGSGGFTENTNANLTGVFLGSLTSGDFDGDLDLDLVVTGYDGGGPIAKIYENDGSGGFTENTNANLTGVNAGSVATADFDGDNDPDLVVTGSSGSGLITKIYENDGSGGFSENTNANLTGVYNSSVAWGDFDGDDDPDLVVTGNSSNGQKIAKIYENDGSGGFTENTNANLTGVYNSSVATADFDGDDDPDLVVTGEDSNRNRIAKIYENDGSGGFTENTNANLTGVNAGSVATADFDGDNDPDLLVTGLGDSGPIAKIYENDGSGGFTENTNANLTGVAYGSVAWGDFDGDNDPDLVVTGNSFNGRIANVYLNNPLPANELPVAVEDSATTQAGQEVIFSLTDNDTDSDGTIDVATVDLDPTTDGRQDTLAVPNQGEFMIPDDAGNVTFTPVSGFTGESTINYTVNDNLGGTSNSANISVTVNAAPIVGTTGRDTLEGTTAVDNQNGGEGNDTLVGSLGADTLIGGGGSDRILYKSSASAVTVSLAANTATGGDADGDTYDSIENLDGSKFDDFLTGDDNNNRFYGGKGNDTLVGNAGDDYLSGQNGDDELSGGAGKDRLLGGSGNDMLMGGADNDILSGGRGDDSLGGAAGATNGVGEIDRLMGGAGADVFVLGTTATAYYDDGDSATDGIADYALISSFDAAEDVIELSSSQTYYLDVNPMGTSSGTGIYIDSDSSSSYTANDELVGLVAGMNMTGLVEPSTAGFSLV